MEKAFLSKATGSNGAFCWVSHCISLTKTDAAPEQCDLSWCQEMERYWKAVCCALLESRCVRRGFQNNIKTELED